MSFFDFDEKKKGVGYFGGTLDKDKKDVFKGQSKKNGQNGPVPIKTGTGKPNDNYLKNPKPKGKDTVGPGKSSSKRPKRTPIKKGK